MSVGISLGWRCEAASVGVGIGLRSTKNDLLTEKSMNKK